MTSFRTDEWLQERLHSLWETFFRDAQKGYPMEARFGARARYRFGSIVGRHGVCLIRVNGLFAHPDVPEYVVDATLAHELAHYVHGYGSGLKKRHAHPHRGGVIEEEMAQRGCLFLEEKAERWRRQRWQAFYADHCQDRLARSQERRQKSQNTWQAYLETPGFRTEEWLNVRLQTLSAAFGLTEPPFRVTWHRATLRQNGVSYYYPREKVVRLHGLLADTRVPEAVLSYEIAYWIAYHQAGKEWERILTAMRQAGLSRTVERALSWRRRAWTRVLRSRHPLRAD
jgi:hypothetical protein